MRPHVASITGCLMLGGLMTIPLAGVLHVGARNWHRQPMFAPAAGAGASHTSNRPDLASLALASRENESPAGASSSSRASSARQSITADDYVLYWRTSDYAYPNLTAGGLQTAHYAASAASFPVTSDAIYQPTARGAVPPRLSDAQFGPYMLQGATLRVTDADSDEAIRLGESLIAGLGAGMTSERVGSWLYFGPLDQRNVSVGSSALLAGSDASDIRDVDGNAIEPVTPTMPTASPTAGRNLDNMIIASADRSPGRSGPSSATAQSPSRYDPTSPFGLSAPSAPNPSSEPVRGPMQPPATNADTPVAQPPSGARPSGATIDPGVIEIPGQPGTPPAPLPAPIPLPLPGEAQPPGAPAPAPVFGDATGNPAVPPTVPPADPPRFPPANPDTPGQPDERPSPPAQPPVFPEFIPPLADAITTSDGALPNVPPSLPAFDDDGPGHADPASPGPRPPTGPGAPGPQGLADEDFADSWLPADFGFSAVPEPGALALLLAGLYCCAFRRSPSAPRVTQG